MANLTQPSKKQESILIQLLNRAFSVLGGNISISAGNFIIAGILISKSGLVNYGIFVSLQAAYYSWATVSKPLTWQAIIKYSSSTTPSHLLSISLKTEVIGAFIALIAASVIAVSAIYLWAPSEDYVVCGVMIFFASLMLNNGTTVGYLRVNRRFKTIALLQSLSAILKVPTCLYFAEDIELYFISTLVVDIAIWLPALIVITYKERTAANKNNKPACTGLKLVDFLRFAYWGTLHSTLDLPVTQLDRLLISALISLEAAGIFNLIKRISQIIGQIADPIYQVIFPEFSELLHDRETRKIKEISKKISLAILISSMLTTAVLFILFEPLNNLAFAGEMADYKSELITYLAIQSAALCFIWIHPLFIALGHMKQNAVILLISNIIYTSLIILLAESLSIWGIIIAFLLQSSSLIAMKAYIIKTKNHQYFIGKQVELI